MAVPRHKGNRARASDSRAHGFWDAARLCDAQIGSDAFDSQLHHFGFVKASADTVLAAIEPAMNVMHKLLPWALPVINAATTGQAYFQTLLQQWKDADRQKFWHHPDEPSFAITSSHHFNRPYGGESATLLNFAAPRDSADAQRRQQTLLSLNAAKQVPRKHPQLYRNDSFNALSDGIGGTYRFAKSSATIGRDSVDKQACGATLPENGPKLLDAPGAPYLYLHLSSAYLAI